MSAVYSCDNCGRSVALEELEEIDVDGVRFHVCTLDGSLCVHQLHTQAEDIGHAVVAALARRVKQRLALRQAVKATRPQPQRRGRA